MTKILLAAIFADVIAGLCVTALHQVKTVLRIQAAELLQRPVWCFASAIVTGTGLSLVFRQKRAVLMAADILLRRAAGKAASA